MAGTTTKLTQLKYIQRVTGKDSEGNMTLEPMIVGANAYIYTNKNILLTNTGTPTSSFGTKSAYIGTNVSGSGNNSIYLGTGIKGISNNQLVIGQYNDSTDKAFVIGNGTDKQSSDAFTVDTSGNIESAGALTVVGITSKGKLTVTGEFTAKANATFDLGLTAKKAIIANDGVQTNNLTPIDTNGKVTIHGDMDVTGTSDLAGLKIGNDLTVEGIFTAKGTTSLTGKLTAKGGIEVQNSISTDGLTNTGSTTLTKKLTANGGISTDGLTNTGSTTLTGALTANGGIEVQNSISTDGLTNTGSTTLKGDVSANNLDAHGNFHASGTVNNTVTIDPPLTANAGVFIYGGTQMYGGLELTKQEGDKQQRTLHCNIDANFLGPVITTGQVTIMDNPLEVKKGVHTDTIAALDSDNISMSNQVTFTKPIIAQEAVTIGAMTNRMNLTTYGMIAVRHKEDSKNSVESLTFMVDEAQTTVSNTLVVGAAVKGGEAEVLVHGEATVRSLHLTGETQQGGRIRVDYEQDGDTQTQVINLLELFRDVERIKAQLNSM